MTTPRHLQDLEARGLRLVRVGDRPHGRPPKTARDVAVYLAECWFGAGTAGNRPKTREAVVDLWRSKGYPGISHPSNVTARKKPALAAVGDTHTTMTFKGDGTTRGRVGEGAGVLLLPASSVAEDGPGVLRFHGPVWSWAYGAETAEHYEATGAVEYRPKN